MSNNTPDESKFQLPLLVECATCMRLYKPSSAHKDCPRCRYKQTKGKFKCVDCGIDISKNRKRCKSCKQFGPRNQNWKGGKWYLKNGYVMCHAPDHPRTSKHYYYVFEHILVMEEHIGRYLVKGETVHHKNGIKDDNRIENLELWTTNHPSGIRAEDAVELAIQILELYAPEKLK